MSTENNQDLTQALAGLGDRISKIADLVGGKKNLARVISISESQLYRYIAGDSQPTVEPLAAIAKCGNVHLDWLVLGEGPTGISAEVNDLKGIYSTKQEFISISEYREENVALENKPVNSMGRLSFNHFWLLKSGLNPEHLRLIRAHGDSMAPTIKDGNLLMMDISQLAFNGDAVYVLRLNENCLVAKRLQQSVDKGLYLVNDNPAYREQHIPDSQRDSLKIVGKVVWAAGLL